MSISDRRQPKPPAPKPIKEPSRPSMSDEELSAVVQRLQAGNTYWSIARELGLPYTTVQRINTGVGPLGRRAIQLANEAQEQAQ